MLVLDGGQHALRGDAAEELEGALSDLVRRRKHPDGIVTYMIDRNINYTNTCNAFCNFCAFYRPPHHEEGYVQPVEEIERKIRETYELGGNQILLQGGQFGP